MAYGFHLHADLEQEWTRAGYPGAKAFAAAAGVHRTNLHRVMTGTSGPSPRLMAGCVRALSVNGRRVRVEDLFTLTALTAHVA